VSCHNAKRHRSPLFADHAADRREDYSETGCADRDAGEQASSEDDHGGTRRCGHQDERKGIQKGPTSEDHGTAVAVRERPCDGLADPPHDALQRNSDAPRPLNAVEYSFNHRIEEDAERRPDSK